MMTTTTGSIVLDAPANEVWALFRDFGGLTKWFSGAASCTVADGKATDQIGAVRMVEVPNAGGFKVPERLTGLSDEDRVLTYVIDCPTDLGAVKTAQGTKSCIQVREITHGGGGTYLRMEHRYEVTEGDPAVLLQFMQGVYQHFFDDLKKHFAG